MYITDCFNHRIVEWKCDENNGKIIAGGNGEGDRTDQLSYPTNIVFDQQNNSLIIADHMNRRVVRWPGQNHQILISDIDCFCLAMDKNGFMYISDSRKNEVKRWKEGDQNGILVAGGNEEGDRLNQLNSPTYIFVDDDCSIYITDRNNHRVMKWHADAKEGIIVAGGNDQGGSLKQLSYPSGVIVDRFRQIYVTDYDNNRVMRWCEGEAEGSIVVGRNGEGNEAYQLHSPSGLSFDIEGNLYVADSLNNRIQKYEIISDGLNYV